MAKNNDNIQTDIQKANELKPLTNKELTKLITDLQKQIDLLTDKVRGLGAII